MTAETGLTRRAWLGWVATATTFASTRLGAQPAAWKPNYDESKVPAYTLPPTLQFADGRPVRNAADWARRRTELLDLFSAHVYGRTPTESPAWTVQVHEQDVLALDGRARRTQLAVQWKGDAPPLEVLVYTPASATGPVPAFVGLNYFGNQAVVADPGIRLSTRWMRANDAIGIVNHRATEQTRGANARRWPLDAILGGGFGIVTAYYGDLAPDDPAEVRGGIEPLFREAVARVPARERWNALGMWAWGLSRMREVASTLEAVDGSRTIVIGHSRLGKAALWAGAQDERFAMVVSNDSGCGGAALSRRAFGETVGRITQAFPHWFCPRFSEYAERESALPVDQHQLLALVAPRPLHVASATEDLWADPRGEFLAARATADVYRLLGATGLEIDDMPPPDSAVGDRVRYHNRTGIHDIIRPDWEHYLETARKTLPVGGRV